LIPEGLGLLEAQERLVVEPELHLRPAQPVVRVVALGEVPRLGPLPLDGLGRPAVDGLLQELRALLVIALADEVARLLVQVRGLLIPAVRPQRPGYSRTSESDRAQASGRLQAVRAPARDLRSLKVQRPSRAGCTRA
jgi:hypothetical protein